MKVLAIEDNDLGRQLLAEQLAVLGCDATVVPGSGEALDALAAPADDDWDVLLTDLNMPGGMNGHALAQRVQQQWPGLPIVALTAHAAPEEKLRCRACGISRMLTKPVALEVLHDALAEAARPGNWRLKWPSAHAPEDGAMPMHLVELFAGSCEASLSAIESACERNCNVRGASALHSLSGALSVFGHRQLAQACRALCCRLEHESLADLAHDARQLVQAVRSAVHGGAGPRRPLS